MSEELPPPPDAAERDRIIEELDSNMLVEAAAGTGKTTSMVGRMVALLSTGKCRSIRTIAAVTFTRKAAAELRSRFQVELEAAARKARGDEKENLKRALLNIDQCFIGTIHSFCGRLLRERPVEAGVDLAFEEIEDNADARLREEAWDEYSAALFAADPEGTLAELDRWGLELSDLKEPFKRFAGYPDVDEWPVAKPDEDLPPLGPVVEGLREYVAHMVELGPGLPEDDGGDWRLVDEYRRIPRMVRNLDMSFVPDLIEVLKLFKGKPPSVSRELRSRGWGDFAKEEQARWKAFGAEHAAPVIRELFVLRHRAAMRALTAAREAYDRLRDERGKLNFQDLLMKASALLRDKPNIRRYFRERFTHLLVDEFQDTDPIQAQVILFLTATDDGETDWRKCRPGPGSLFVVGDPKQSIYRFRRADIVTYNDVKAIIETDGSVVKLSANFRTTGGVVDWVNDTFAGRFPEEASRESPAYVSLTRGRVDGNRGDINGVRLLRVPEESSQKNQDAVEHNAEFIARTVRRAVDEGLTVSRTKQELKEGSPPEALYSDFMIITYAKKNLAVYARKLQELGIPHRVTGGTALNELPELKLLHTCLKAVVETDNPVSLVAALRSELFGVSDTALYSFKKAGGRFDYRWSAPLTPTLSPEGRGGTETLTPNVSPEGRGSPDGMAAIIDAFEKLRRYSRWLTRLPPVAAIERIMTDLGLMVLACSRDGGDVEAGSLAKALELLRCAQGGMWAAAQLVDYLGRLVEETEEKYDGISALSGERPAVRVMNLHQAKGLEAPVVFLADPTGASAHDVQIHIDRSGEKVLGYMPIYRERPYPYSPTLVANPGDWDSLKEVEKVFLEAERTRLMYVTVTRGGSCTVITQRKGAKNRNNPWAVFEGEMECADELADPGPRSAPPLAEEELSVDAVRDAAMSIASRLAEAGSPTYDALPAKEFALSDAAGQPAEGVSFADADVSVVRESDEGEHGVEWGNAIHQLLEIAMKNPEADLQRFAEVVLPENGLDTTLAGTAVDSVSSVMASEIWRRAHKSELRLMEVPFQLLIEEDVRVPTVVRGAIDLVFKEKDGWVLVDYKTDTFKGRKPGEALVAKYSPQVRLYARAWERCTGEKVKETALYFLRADLLVTIG